MAVSNRPIVNSTIIAMYNVQTACEEAKLLELLAADSEYAFKMLYNQHHKRIYSVAMRYLKSTEQAEEVVQDVFMKLWVQRNNLIVRGPIEAWLFTVAKNHTINKLKKQANEWKALNQLKLTHESEDNSMQNKLAEADYQLVLKEALSGLSEKQLRVYTLARQENLSYVQIAEQMEISPLTVKTHMARALGSIRAMFGAQRLFS